MIMKMCLSYMAGEYKELEERYVYAKNMDWL